MKPIGLALVILGLVALVYAGIGYGRQRTVLDVGGVKATVTDHKDFPVVPIAGGLALLVGGALVMNRRRIV